MMARRTNNKIRKKHLILCEGRDAEEFLIQYLNSKALSGNSVFSEDFQVMDFGGITELTDFVQMLQNMEKYNTVESILIIRDAETDSAKAVREVQGTLQRCGFEVPDGPCLWRGYELKVGYLLFPTCDSTPRNGALEDLCLSILAEDIGNSIVLDIRSFMDLLREKYGRVFPHEFKTKLHTYFSVTDTFVSLKIGESAKAGAFNWNSDKLEPLKNFLLELYN